MYSLEEVKEVLNNISCELLGQKYIIKFDEEKWTVNVGMERKCCYTGKIGVGFGGKAYLSPHSTKDEIVKKILGLCIAYAEHEVREGFLYLEKRLFNPHLTIDALMSIAGETTSREEEHG